MKDLIRKILKEEVENLSEDFKKSNDTFPPFIRFQLEKISLTLCHTIYLIKL